MILVRNFKVFNTFLFCNSPKLLPKIIAIPYSIGLASGIIIFFNHIFAKKITDDPTPIEVEMSLYEKDIFDTNVNNLQLDKNKKQKNK